MARAKSQPEPVTLVFGGTGMLGREVLAALPGPVWAPTRAEFDLVNADLEAFVGTRRIAAVVNCAAYTAVDRAEQEPILARELNHFWPKNLGAWATKHRVPVVHISTDFVFDGTATEPYAPDAPLNPQGVYAQTKAAGERYITNGWILRTSWLFGRSGACFPRTMIRAWLAGRPLRVVHDQRGTPTFAPDLAGWIAALLRENPPFQTFHASGDAILSWFEFARLAIETYAEVHGLSEPIAIEPIRTADWPAPAPRPAFSALDSTAIHAQFGPPTPLVEALRDFAERNPPEVLLGP